jgi:hypothetical protein
VYPFEGSVLLPNLTTTASKPEETYQVDGVRYEVTSYLTIMESDGRRAFDVQVERIQAAQGPVCHIDCGSIGTTVAGPRLGAETLPGKAGKADKRVRRAWLLDRVLPGEIAGEGPAAAS